MSEDAEPEPVDGRPHSAHGGSDGVRAVPGLVRIAASAWWHTTGWAVGNSLHAGRRLAEVALAPQKVGELAEEVRDATRKTIRELLDLADVEERVNGAVSRSLRDDGEALLRRSRDVHYSEEAHPAYARILSELAPDEGRILQMLLLKGPQPAVDVRTGGPIGMVSSRLIAPGLTMIGPRAGCRYVERTPSYLHNLFRLGMVWFSRETLRDPLPYQVLEAQPDVLGATHSVKYAKIVRRSIHLTPFGEDFCRVSLWTESTGTLDQLPAHSRPPEAEIAPAPTDD
jgi:Abortive infection alpha